MRPPACANQQFLLDCPHTHTRRMFSIVIMNSCAAGREMPCTRNQSKHMHDNSHGDRVYGQTATHSKSRQHNLPNYRISYHGLGIVFVSNFRVPTQKTLICNTALSIRASSRTIDVTAAPQCNLMMSKEPERKTIRHVHNTRDQNTGPFSKRKIKDVFSVIDPKQGYLGPVCPKER